MRPNWPALASQTNKTCTLYTLSSLGCSLLPKHNLFPKNIFDFTTAGMWDGVTVVKRLSALHHRVDSIIV